MCFAFSTSDLAHSRRLSVIASHSALSVVKNISVVIVDGESPLCNSDAESLIRVGFCASDAELIDAVDAVNVAKLLDSKSCTVAEPTASDARELIVGAIIASVTGTTVAGTFSNVQGYGRRVAIDTGSCIPTAETVKLVTGTGGTAAESEPITVALCASPNSSATIRVEVSTGCRSLITGIAASFTAVALGAVKAKGGCSGNLAVDVGVGDSLSKSACVENSGCSIDEISLDHFMGAVVISSVKEAGAESVCIEASYGQAGRCNK